MIVVVTHHSFIRGTSHCKIRHLYQLKMNISLYHYKIMNLSIQDRFIHTEHILKDIEVLIALTSEHFFKFLVRSTVI